MLAFPCGHHAASPCPGPSPALAPGALSAAQAGLQRPRRNGCSCTHRAQGLLRGGGRCAGTGPTRLPQAAVTLQRRCFPRQSLPLVEDPAVTGLKARWTRHCSPTGPKMRAPGLSSAGARVPLRDPFRGSCARQASEYPACFLRGKFSCLQNMGFVSLSACVCRKETLEWL